MPDLSLVCVSKLESICRPFLKKMSDWSKKNNVEFVLGVDGSDTEIELAYDYTAFVVPVRSLGYLESVLNDVKSKCTGDYIFRLDDDEFFSENLSKWLIENRGKFTEKAYSFPRYELWKDENHHIFPLYPATQVRLFSKNGGIEKRTLHSIPSYGYGIFIDRQILHYKFLIRSYEDRKRIAEVYESVHKGAGFGDYLVYNLPEDHYRSLGLEVPTAEIT